ncbi:MAG: 16S rRNA (cytosine(1402)-N(4))-methyltransferase [Candidatus Magasanikbacteria bacterium CG10_big_fil_rev_8_21_14_0_10_43_6]|uniref:Ribosomal RNA small subunit methyltransferase H n=1 Tax=Candidatus Magasanikbacteria bacterium CG10_big_fil_rev_8_21_14_0_10_43_6 TaxID=1974650 RepID=A0A2M6W0T8_9BACT|nr:MAG: 16S rRNA (cytosine(1402)-N(4))-methyltransferase [Candidatus Magasanikbacteria bacterium CG10_big_fil_rev_8_21_14_0_10_43_6]
MTRHIPVLKNEVLEALNLKQGDNVIDATLGDAGHAEAILNAIAPNGKLLGIDMDPEAILRAKQFLYTFQDRATFVRNNFEQLKEIVDQTGFGPVQAILLDLGWSTPQFEERGRGFSFLRDEPLDMRYGATHQKVSAKDVLNTYSQDVLEKIFKEYGEEKLSNLIAQAIVEFRKDHELSSTGELVEIVLGVYRKKLGTDKEIPWIGGLHPATRIFQAIRIEVNNELEALTSTLPQIVEVLDSGGRAAVISFHSLEDRIVKHYFKSIHGKTVQVITKKPIVCGEEEYEHNPPSRSAKLRVIQKI